MLERWSARRRRREASADPVDTLNAVAPYWSAALRFWADARSAPTAATRQTSALDTAGDMLSG